MQKVAKLSATVLILGESGTGKELLARLIHRESAHPKCRSWRSTWRRFRASWSRARSGTRKAPSPERRQQLRKFELANNGTLFLDEVGDLRYDLQAKLLPRDPGERNRAGRRDSSDQDELRLIAATNVDLDKAVKEGRFREDLYYRLKVIPIRMPALRDRIEDLPALAQFFLRRYNLKFRKNIQESPTRHADPGSYWWPEHLESWRT